MAAAAAGNEEVLAGSSRSLGPQLDPLADLVAGREARLLLLGLRKITASEKAPESGRLGTARTAEQLLGCVRRVQGELQKSRVQHQLMRLVHETVVRRQQAPTSPRAEAAEEDVMKEVAAKSSFWQVIRCDYWRKRQQAPRDLSPEPTADARPALLRSSMSQSSIAPASPAVPKPMSMPPTSSPALRRGLETLRGFRQSAGQLRPLHPPARLLSLDGAVNLLKERGVWEELPSPARLTSPGKQLSRAPSAGCLPPLAHAPKPSDEETAGAVQPLQVLTPLAVFPELANRRPLAPRRLIFVDSNGVDSPQRLAEVMEVRDPLLTAAADAPNRSLKRQATSRSSTASLQTRRGKHEALDATFKHPPRWARSKSVVEKLSSSGILKTMGPQEFPRTDIETGQFEKTPELAYVTAYSESGLMPKIHRSVTNAMLEAKSAEDSDGQSLSATHRVNMANYGVGGAALQALSDSLQHLGRLESLNLACNKLHGSRAAEFLRLQLPLHGSALKELDLSGNRDLGAGSIEVITDLLHKGGLRVLHSLHLDGVIVPEELWEPLLHELADSGCVKVFTAADSHLGFRSQAAFSALARVLTRGVLEKLDISGNYLRQEGCEQLGRALAESDTLLDLDLSHNASDPLDVSPAEQESKDATSFSPLLHICEGLARNVVLERFALANCGLGYAADFLLGEAAARHPRLGFMDLSANTHGSLGLACLLRAVGQPESRMQKLDVSDARASGMPAPAVCYDWAEPSGRYSLHLVNPQHRAVLRALLNRPAINGKASVECFREVQASKQEKGWSIASCTSLDFRGMATVPLKGTVSFTYTVPPPSTPRGEPNPLAKVSNVRQQGKLPLRLQRSPALLASYGSCRTDEQRSLFLEALGSCFLLRNAHLDLFLRHSNPTLDLRRIVKSVLHAVDKQGALCTPTAVRSQLGSGAEVKVRADAAQSLFLNLRSPTGRYRLDLANPSDHACAGALQALCSFERKLHLAQGRPDVSQFGNQEPVRNLRLGHELRSLSGFSLPRSGDLELDYVSTAWPPRGAAALQRSGVVAQIISALHHARLPWAEALLALRTVLDGLSLTAEEVRALVEAAGRLPGQAADKPARVEMMVLCFGRCAERGKLATPAVMYDPELFSAEEAAALRSRLGRANVLDARGLGSDDTNLPDGSRFALDLAVHEDRQIALFLTELAKRESPSFLSECSVTGLVWKPELLGSDAFPPSAGNFSGRYAAAEPEQASQAARQEVALKVLGLVV